MRRLISSLVFVPILVGLSVFEVQGQIRSNRSLPINANILSSVVYQADNPLKIEEVLSVLEDRRLNTYYTVRNTGAKPIKYYRIAHWFSDNTGYLIGGGDA